MLYFRENEKDLLSRFFHRTDEKAMAIYGRRRTGKTQLILDFLSENGSEDAVYFQCASFDYQTCLQDFISCFQVRFPEDPVLQRLGSFREIFSYLPKLTETKLAIIIDEFPFLAKKDENVAVEFQWIIDHALQGNKLVLLGSSLSFMRRQINQREAPLYGRFDEILEVRPFLFHEVHTLFPDFEDAVQVYAQTGGVAQYVMFFLRYSSPAEATKKLFLDRNGRLFQEANNMLLQELRDTSTYAGILRAISSGEKTAAQIADRCGLDPRGVFTYLNKLSELEIVTPVENLLSSRKKERRYKIGDFFFRFHYSFIEPNISMIQSVGLSSYSFIFGDRYQEYLGFVYEDIIRDNCFQYALDGKLTFMPVTTGKWWGNVCLEGTWTESEIDVLAFDDHTIVLGECKFRNKKIGLKELNLLLAKAQFVPVKGRKIYYLLASRSGFTEDLSALSDDVILIEKV